MQHTIKTHVLHATRLVRNALRDHITGGTRSSKWPKIEHEHLSKNPTCAACGGITRLNVHHMKPFHLDPALELDEANLITLCMGIGHDCHILIGHGDDFKAFNPNVKMMSAAALTANLKGDKATVSSIEDSAKANRKYEISA